MYVILIFIIIITRSRSHTNAYMHQCDNLPIRYDSAIANTSNVYMCQWK